MSQTSYGRFSNKKLNLQSQSAQNFNSNKTFNSNNTNSFITNNVTSIRPDCLDYLRFPKNNKKGRTHLLAFMSQYFQDKTQNIVQQVQQLCCYDRIKRLLKKDNQQGSPNDYENKLTKAIHIQAKLNNMEKSLTKYNQERQKKYQKYQKIRKGKSYHNIAKKAMIDEVKQRCLQKFISNFKSNRQANIQQFKQQVIKEIQNQVYRILQERDSGYIKLLKQKEQLQRKILQKELQIQQAKVQLVFLREQLLLQKDSVQSQQKNAQLKQIHAMHEQWFNEFKQNFPDSTIPQIKKNMQNLQDRCLRELRFIDQKNERQRKDNIKFYQSSIDKLKQQIKKIQRRESEQVKKLHTLQQTKQLSSLQIDKLIQAKKKLDHLHNVIFSQYNLWYGQRNQSQKQMLKKLGYLKQDYDYQQMIYYILEYKQKFSTDFKLNQYIIKILRGVHKLKKIVEPKTANDKLDPFSALQHLQKWVKFKINQQAIKGGSKNQRISLKNQDDYYLND